MLSTMAGVPPFSGPILIPLVRTHGQRDLGELSAPPCSLQHCSQEPGQMWEQPQCLPADERVKMCACVSGRGVSNEALLQPTAAQLSRGPQRPLCRPTGLRALGRQPRRHSSAPPGDLFFGIGEKCPRSPWAPTRGWRVSFTCHDVLEPQWGGFLPAGTSPRWRGFRPCRKPQP